MTHDDPLRASSAAALTGLLVLAGDLRARGDDGVADYVILTHDDIARRLLDLLEGAARCERKPAPALPLRSSLRLLPGGAR